jgi:hypothetical protein
VPAAKQTSVSSCLTFSGTVLRCILPDSQQFSLRIIGADGRLVSQMSRVDTRYKMDMSELSDGAYTAHLQRESGTETLPFILRR